MFGQSTVKEAGKQMSPTKHGNVLSWASAIETNTLEQAQRSANLPFIAGHLALMPDAHYGYGATIGSVIPTSGAIIPSAIGVDIGCGMCAAQLPFTVDFLPDDLDRLHGYITKVVPAGLGQGHQNSGGAIPGEATMLDAKQRETAHKQMGSLGGGNHFVEVCTDEDDCVWVILHSGSRGIGKKLADQHIAKAKGLMKAYFIELEDPDLAYLVEGTPEFDEYIAAMLWAQDYAMMNRRTMLGAVLEQVAGFVGREFEVSQLINCHHNFTQLENHHGRNLWITRKGAIRARVGDLGLIPGSMGTRSYVVEGLGSPASYCSCSHGAGRRMGRKQAERLFTADDLRQAMEGKSWNETDAAQLVDEIPMAYKDIDQVMADQQDLVTIKHTLRQLLNYKGVK